MTKRKAAKATKMPPLTAPGSFADRQKRVTKNAMTPISAFLTNCRGCGKGIFVGEMTVFGRKDLGTHVALGLMHEGCSE